MPSTTLATPIGDLRIVVRKAALEAIDFVAEIDTPGAAAEDDAVAGRAGSSTRRSSGSEARDEREERDERDEAALATVCGQLEEYFSGRRQHFDLRLRLHGTPFQVGVWERLCDIGYGETISYGELARSIGKPGAARAVGLANGRNPIPIVVPCHRVIGSDGSLTGYGGGMPRKQALLEIEGALAPASGQQAALF